MSFLLVVLHFHLQGYLLNASHRHHILTGRCSGVGKMGWKEKIGGDGVEREDRVGDGVEREDRVGNGVEREDRGGWGGKRR